jgi:hypothetical protein
MIGEKIDKLYEARSARLRLEAQVKELKAQETDIKTSIMAELAESGLQGAKGQIATASLTYKVQPDVKDWDAVYAYIKANDAFNLLHRRITTTLWESMLDDGEEIPGIIAAHITDLSLTKSTR